MTRIIIDSTQPQRLFKAVYPFVNLGIDLTFLGYDLAYLFNKTDHYRPWHRVLGLRIQRRGHEDDDIPDNSIFSRLPPLIPPLLLLLKLSQWWYSPSSPRTLTNTATTSSTQIHRSILPPRPLPILPLADLLPLTPPTTPPQETQLDISKPKYAVTKENFGKCPLCSKKWQNPAVLPSGWVVCWRCGWDAVEGDEADGRCPITGVEVGPGQLRRVLV